MRTAVSLVSLLALLWAGILPVPALPGTPILTQESFNLDQFMGRWYEVALVSTCGIYMRSKKENPVIVALELKNAASESNITVALASFSRNGVCRQTSTVYNLADTSGQFYYYVARLEGNVDLYVVHTNYDEYAMIAQRSTNKSSGITSTVLRLYSRTVDVRAAVMDDFKALVRQHGMKEGAIIVNENKGQCVPGDQPTPPSQVDRLLLTN